MPRSNTQFKPGESGNPAGRPPGSKGGRATLLDMFDEALSDCLSKKEMREKLAEDVMRKFTANPVGFLIKIGMPLLPKELLLHHTGDAKLALRLVLERGTQEVGGGDEAAKAEQATSGSVLDPEK